MHIAYAGQAGTPHTEAYLRFLCERGRVTFVAVDALATTDLSRFDLLIVDAAWRHPVPSGLTLEHLGLPTVLVGNFGVKVGDQLHLKFGSKYGCMCLGEDAIVWDDSHLVFEGLADTIVAKEPPPNFQYFASILDVPPLVPTLRVLRDTIDTPGQVTAGFGFLDSPECEIIAGGFNEKTQAHFAVARQGRFLHWGFSGSPEQYTPQGRRLLANCLHYLAHFANDPVRAFRTTAPRAILRFLLSMEGWRGIGLPLEMRASMAEQFLRTLFAMEIPAAVYGELPERLAWLEAHMPYLRNDGRGWLLDVDAQVLGLAIDDTALLEVCLSAPGEHTARIWQRYTGRTMTSVEGERTWLAKHRAHLYFTDWGGYRWVSLLEAPAPLPPPVAETIPEASGTLGAARYGDDIKAMLLLELPPGFHAYAPDSSEGLPMSIAPGPGFELLGGLELHATEGRLSGAVPVMFASRGEGDELSVSVRLQLCDSLTCLMPQTLELRCPIQVTD